MKAKYLIVNADDYGYYSCVSKGILEGVKYGSITATGIMANSPKFNENIEWLKTFNELDKGVHLNISYGRPLTYSLNKILAAWHGLFPSKLQIVKAILMGSVPISEIENEWRAQIEKCLNNGIEITFLNSHEHLHMLPPLNKLFNNLIRDYGLIHSRFSTPEWTFTMTPDSLIRNTALGLMGVLCTRPTKCSPPKILGMNESGKVTLAYLKKIFRTLKPGSVYELMCHPGYFDKNEITDPNLLNYHNWEEELNLLMSDDFKKLCLSENIELISYLKLRKFY